MPPPRSAALQRRTRPRPIPVQGPPVGAERPRRARRERGRGLPADPRRRRVRVERRPRVEPRDPRRLRRARRQRRPHRRQLLGRPQRAHHRPVAALARPARRRRARGARRRAPRQPGARSGQPRPRRRGIADAAAAPTASTCSTSTRRPTRRSSLEDTLATAEWLVESGKVRALGAIGYTAAQLVEARIFASAGYPRITRARRAVQRAAPARVRRRPAPRRRCAGHGRHAVARARARLPRRPPPHAAARRPVGARRAARGEPQPPGQPHAAGARRGRAPSSACPTRPSPSPGCSRRSSSPRRS